MRGFKVNPNESDVFTMRKDSGGVYSYQSIAVSVGKKNSIPSNELWVTFTPVAVGCGLCEGKTKGIVSF